MSIICDECDGRICREQPERCNPNMTVAEKLEALKENKGEAKLKCACETKAIHEIHEVDGVKVELDIDLKGEGLIRIRAVGQEPPEPLFVSKAAYQKPKAAGCGYAIVCDYCPVCGRKLKEDRHGKNKD